jgi:stage III sporulation protein AG
MSKMRKFFGDRDEKGILKIILAFSIGIILLIISSSNKNKTTKTDTQQKKITNVEYSYERNLETRLESLLSQVNGVGKVKVMITLVHGKEIVVAQDSNQSESKSIGTDKTGSTKEEQNTKKELKKIIVDGKTPLVIKEIEPKIEGVIIIAQGGDNVNVKSDLVKSAQIILNVPANKVQILKMQN